jgi:hypothetical protein
MLGLRYAISGSLAARWRAPYAEPRLALFYTDALDQVEERLSLRKSERPNVLIIEPEDDLPFVRTWAEGGGTYAALPQVAVDFWRDLGGIPRKERHC